MNLKKMSIREAIKGIEVPVEIRGIVEPAQVMPKVEKIEATDNASVKVVDDVGDEWQVLNLSELAREAAERSTGFVARLVAKYIGIKPADVVVLGRAIGILYRMIKARL